ncbi:MAG TPA: flagellar export chaperone FliS [Anaeromyxobacteraceae bacterium]|nr:flagellar export chaperone FliS [Anaeromyxobacteraceae bacterium]
MIAAARRYARSQNETASPERLMALLFEAAVRHMRSGAAALDGGRPAEANHALCRATEIVCELGATFDRARFPELAKNLEVVYGFVSSRLIAANARRDAALAREAERVLLPVADAFGEAVRKVQAERAGEAR